MDGMACEHCIMYGFDRKFVTANYGIVTCPRDEFEIVMGQRACPEENLVDPSGRRVRWIRPLSALRAESVCVESKLTDPEIVAVVRQTLRVCPPTLKSLK